jgi:hypothetical protein
MWVMDRLSRKHPEWEIVVGETTGSEWCKADAVADGLTHTDADLIVLHDADVWAPNVAEAVENCRTWAIPHLMVHRLTVSATEDLIATGLPGAGLDRNPYRGFAGGGITVVPRHVYEQCPLDPRFVGWGQEDASWALALECLYGPARRGKSDLWHLWHPPQPRLSIGTGSHEGQLLYRRYRNASRHPDVMRELMAEATMSMVGR